MPTVAKRNRSLSESSISREDKRRANNSEKTEYNMDLNDIKTSITGINDTLQMILTQSNKTNDDLEEIKKDNREYKQKVDTLGNHVVTLTDDVKKLDIKLNNLEQYGRNCSIRIFGLQIDENQTIDAVLNLLLSININITAHDIIAAHPLKNLRNQNVPQCIVKFARPDIKNNVIYARKKLKGRTISIQEDLSVANKQLLNRVKNDERVQNAWSFKGEIWCLLHSGQKLKVKLHQSLDDAITQKYGEQSTTALNRNSNAERGGGRGRGYGRGQRDWGRGRRGIGRRETAWHFGRSETPAQQNAASQIVPAYSQSDVQQIQQSASAPAVQQVQQSASAPAVQQVQQSASAPAVQQVQQSASASAVQQVQQSASAPAVQQVQQSASATAVQHAHDVNVLTSEPQSSPPPVQMEQRLRIIANEGAPGTPISYSTPISNQKPPGMPINYEHNESMANTFAGSGFY